MFENNGIDGHRSQAGTLIGVPPDPPGGWNSTHRYPAVGHGTRR